MQELHDLDQGLRKVCLRFLYRQFRTQRVLDELKDLLNQSRNHGEMEY